MILRSICKSILNVYCHLIFRIKVNGIENVPKDKAVILCPNHVHFFDSITLIIHFKKMIYAMSKEELFNTKFKNWIMREFGCYPVKRGSGDVEAIEYSKKLLQEGNILLIFPEGTRNGLEKGVKLKKGAALLALSENVPIVPVGISRKFQAIY